MTTFSGQPRVVNGDTVIGFTNTKKIKSLQWFDMASLASWYEEDPNKNHLGLIELFSTMSNTTMPSYKQFFDEGAVLEVNGANGRFTYDLPVTKPSGCYTMEDTSAFSAFAGIDGSVFPIVLGEKFQQGDVLTYDAQYGEQVIVSEDHEVKQKGDVFEHYVKLVSQDKSKFYDSDKLKAGIQYFKIGHALGEYSTQFSGLSEPDNVGTITCEFILGNHRGVESFYTMYADMKSIGGASVDTKKFWDKYKAAQEKIGVDSEGNVLDMFFVGKLDKSGKLNTNTVRIGATLEYLVVLELMKIEATQLLFQKPAVITDINGTKRLNEGIWHQYRRGRIIKYPRPNGITREHIKEAVAFLFRNRKDMRPHERRIKFKAGYMAHLNIMNIFREEVRQQLNGLIPFIGTDRVLPSSPVGGKDLMSLEMKPVMFKTVNIPEIGTLEIEYDPSLDQVILADRNESGFLGDGYAHTSYSLVMYDASNPEYSNALTNLPSGTTLTGGDKGKNQNVFYVKPEGANLFWGARNGRYAGLGDSARDIASTMKRMGREVFAHSISAGWVRDITKYIVIELQR